MTTVPSHKQHSKEKATDREGSDGEHSTILFNCSCHTFDSVIEQLMYAVGCSYAAARRYAHVIHSVGQATVFTGSQEACEDVADKLAEIGLKVRVV